MPIQSINPKNGQIMAEYEPLDDSGIEAAIAAAQKAFGRQKAGSFSSRAQGILRVAEILEAREEEFARMMTDEMGKILPSARMEVRKCALACRYYAEKAEFMLADRVVETEHRKAYVRYLPLGVVLAVMPWNFPFWQVFRFAVPAVMAGNTVLLKHASNVPQCALAMEGVFTQAGFEKGVFQTLLIGSEKVGDIIADPRIRAVTLTGSEGAGSSVAAQAGKYIKKTVMELGGSDPFIVMPSADMEEAVKMAVRARAQNNGQTCIAAKRYIVHEAVYEPFRAALVEAFMALKVGDPMAEGTDVGPLATAKIRDELDAQVQETLRLGAVRLCGAQCMESEGNFYRPGVLESVPKNSPAYKDELFGPVGLLFKVSSMEEAITLANDTRFGLGSTVMTQDEGEIEQAVNGIEAGCTFINAIVSSDIRLPFGGVKSSGFGRELGEEGIREFTNIKTIIVK